MKDLRQLGLKVVQCKGAMSKWHIAEEFKAIACILKDEGAVVSLRQNPKIDTIEEAQLTFIAAMKSEVKRRDFGRLKKSCASPDSAKWVKYDQATKQVEPYKRGMPTAFTCIMTEEGAEGLRRDDMIAGVYKDPMTEKLQL